MVWTNCTSITQLYIGHSHYLEVNYTNPDPVSTTKLTAKLIDVARNSNSVILNITITEDDIEVYNNDNVISVSEYEQYDQTMSWRVHVDSAYWDESLPIWTRIRICSETVGGGGDPTWTPGITFTDLVQRFDTTGYGQTGGLRFEIWSENIGLSECTVPTYLDMNLYSWGGSYSSSLSNSSLSSDEYLMSPENVDTSHAVIFVWDDLPQGEYVWRMHIISTPEDGSFYFPYDTDSTKSQSWVDGMDFLDVDSWIFGLDDIETYEKVISVGDQFKLEYYHNILHYYDVIDGKDNVKVNISPTGNDAVYNPVGTTTELVGGIEKGRIVGGCKNVKI